jgi:hypothetical protein
MHERRALAWWQIALLLPPIAYVAVRAADAILYVLTGRSLWAALGL